MRKEEEAGSFSMNNDTKNDYICSGDYNIGGDEDDNNNTNLKHNSQAWGTWEELLLACAVKRHGFSDWDSVAMEVRSRSSISSVFVSANDCRQKYRDLKRRFQESGDGEGKTDVVTAEDGGEEDIIGNIPWLEQLRSLRMAELRREVQRYDVSILSLQLKVKKLEEERGEDQKPDLKEERKEEKSGIDGSKSEHREKAVSASDESDQENRSMNESNSTASGGKTAGEDERIDKVEPSHTNDYSGDVNPDPDTVYKAEAAEEGTVSRGSEATLSGELGESGTSESKWKRKPGGRKNYHGGDGYIGSAASKSQLLLGLIDLIRSHPRGSLFEHRLRSQETKDYKSLVKQHLDIKIIQRKLKEGSYDSSSLSFYRDLHLLFTNAIVFFPSSSSESMAAHELRTVVSEEMKKETASAMTKPETEISGSSLSRQKSPAASLVVCKKRKLVSSPSSSSFSQKEKTKEDIVTGTRSSRRANKVVADVVGKGKNKQKQTEVKSQETSKTEKKKSVADFLKRLKKNSPEKEGKNQSKSGKKESKVKPRELRSNNVGKKKAEIENTPVKKSPGRPQKKTVEAAATASATGKRGRENGNTGKDNKQPKKRSKR